MEKTIVIFFVLLGLSMPSPLRGQRMLFKTAPCGFVVV
jgi:hypothetical protein